MVPGFDESLNDKLEQASLKELLPGFDQEVEWAKLSQKLNPPVAGRGYKGVLMYAVLTVLLICGGAAWYKLSPEHPASPAIVQAPALVDTSIQVIKGAVAEAVIKNDTTVAVVSGAPTDTVAPATEAVAKVAVKEAFEIDPYQSPPEASQSQYKKRLEDVFTYIRTKEFVCNGTSCPLEICILQTMHCKGVPSESVATCNTLDPDESGQLKYKGKNVLHRDCGATIDEIRITRANTGETITLNAETPTTATQLFDYLTGKNVGDLLTGIFHSDCNKNKSKEKVVVDNKGDIIIK